MLQSIPKMHDEGLSKSQCSKLSIKLQQIAFPLSGLSFLSRFSRLQAALGSTHFGPLSGSCVPVMAGNFAASSALSLIHSDKLSGTSRSG